MTRSDSFDPIDWMPIVIRADGLSAADRTFCASMIAKSRRAGWQPSWKEAHRMRRIAGDYRARLLREDRP